LHLEIEAVKANLTDLHDENTNLKKENASLMEESRQLENKEKEGITYKLYIRMLHKSIQINQVIQAILNIYIYINLFRGFIMYIQARHKNKWS